MQVFPTTEPLENPSTLSPFKTFPPLFGVPPGLSPGAANPVLIPAFLRPLRRASARLSARPLKAVGGVRGGPERAPVFGYSGPQTEVS